MWCHCPLPLVFYNKFVLYWSKQWICCIFWTAQNLCSIWKCLENGNKIFNLIPLITSGKRALTFFVFYESTIQCLLLLENFLKHSVARTPMSNVLSSKFMLWETKMAYFSQNTLVSLFDLWKWATNLLSRTRLTDPNLNAFPILNWRTWPTQSKWGITDSSICNGSSIIRSNHNYSIQCFPLL